MFAQGNVNYDIYKENLIIIDSKIAKMKNYDLLFNELGEKSDP